MRIFILYILVLTDLPCGGEQIIFAVQDAGFKEQDNMKIVNVPHVDEIVAPIIYILPLQLLSYYVALIKGTDVDQPRNLAKLVMVE